jgi:hypothetical protein
MANRGSLIGKEHKEKVSVWSISALIYKKRWKYAVKIK